jgi:hypothetical protein
MNFIHVSSISGKRVIKNGREQGKRRMPEQLCETKSHLQQTFVDLEPSLTESGN